MHSTTQFISTKNHVGPLANWVVLFSCYTYPITAVFITLSGAPSTPINISLKAIYAVYFLFVIYVGSQLYDRKWHIGAFGFVMFTIIYSIRLLFDTQVRGITFAAGDNFYIYSYYFGATVLPCIAVLVASRTINPELLVKHAYIIMLLANIGIFYLLMTSEVSFQKQLTDRAAIASKKGGENVGSVLNPILIGYYGGLLALMSFQQFIGQTIFKKGLVRYIWLPAFGMGITILVLGASRGPFIAFAILMILSMFYFGFILKGGVEIRLRLMAVLAAIVLLIFRYLIPFIINNDIAMFMRMAKFLDERQSGGEEYRDVSYKHALLDFYDSPLIGNQYVGTYDGHYPHNIFVEVLMSTGVLGATFFAMFLLSLLFEMRWALLHPRKPAIFVLGTMFLFTFFLALSSGSIFVGQDIWVMGNLMISLRLALQVWVKPNPATSTNLNPEIT